MEGWRLLDIMRVGLLDQSAKGWSAGETFARMMLARLELAKADRDLEVVFLSRWEENGPPSSFKSVFIGEQTNRTQWTEIVEKTGLEVIIPIRDQTIYDVDLPIVG